MEKAKKIGKILMSILRTAIFIFFIAFIVVVFLQRFSNNEVSFFNYRMFTVITGSMAPKYEVGDVLISKETDPAEIEIGDAISYLGAVGDFNGKVITHEVIGVEVAEDGKYWFRAKGIANLVEDPIVSEDQLYGVVIHRSIILSLIYRIVGTKWGFYIFIIIPLLFTIGSEIMATLLKKEEKRRAKLKESKEEDKKE